MKRAVLIVTLALSGCVAATDGTGGVEPPRRAADVPGLSYGGLGQTIRIGDLAVRPLSVVEDSRCPINVTCVWAGRVVLRVAITGVGERSISSIEPLRLPDGTLELASISPPRVQGERPPGPYRFGFRRR